MSIDPSEPRRCPDEKYPITEAVCRGRRSHHFPKCKTCKWRDVADQTPPPAESGADLDKIFKAYDIRGLVDSQITKTLAWKVGFGTATHLLECLEPEARFKPEAQEVVVGRDMRPTSEDLARAVAEGIRAAGVGACVIGEVETPAVYFAVGSLAALGGVMVTASHNPVTYNGFKITGPGAVPVGIGSGLEKIREIVAGLGDAHQAAVGPLRMHDISSAYLLHLKKFAGEIRPMKIVVDTSNGMASKWTPSLLREYNLQVEGLNYERAGRFKHEPNPLKEANLEELKGRVRASGAALGACFDGDADRVVFLDETGNTVPGDLTTALLVPYVLAREPGATIIYNLLCSWVVREEILSHNGKPRRERVGHSYIKATMRETNAPFGGELSGHFYFRENFYGDNATIAMLRILTVLSAHPEQTFSELVNPLRRYYATGEVNFEVKDKAGLIKRLARTFSDGKVDFLDGVTVEYDDWWFNCRPSNTEPLLRLCLEAKTPHLRDSKFEELLKILGEPSSR